MSTASALPLLAGLVAATPAALACAPRDAGVDAVALRSDWREYDSNGKQLVRETGTLLGPGLRLSGDCTGWSWQASLARVSGTRDYDGQTQSGTPVRTVSDLGVTRARFDARLPWSAAWQALAGAELVHTDRNIRSTGAALGYPEQFTWSVWRAGVGYRAVFAGGMVDVRSTFGLIPPGQLEVDLPARDPATLTLGSGYDFQLALGWRRPFAGWTFGLELSGGRAVLRRGPDQVITQFGVPAGVAHQPRSIDAHWALTGTLAHPF